MYRVQYATEADLRRAVTQTLALHRTGIPVIDEIQNLSSSRKNKEELFNFTVSLANSLDVPLINVGTPKIRDFMADATRTARRIGTWGVYEWTPLKFADQEWKSFFRNIKSLYVLDEPMQEKAVEKALFSCSQGIAGILVNLFVLSQMQAMVLKEKKLTTRRIKETDALYFSHVEPIVDAIRRNDKVALARYQDVNFSPDNFMEASGMLLGELQRDDK